MITVRKVIKPVYYGGRRGRLTKRAAYLDAAWEAWRAKHWDGGCGCDPEVGWSCPYHRFDNEGPTREAVALSVQRRKVIDRLARWLMWRDTWLDAQPPRHCTNCGDTIPQRLPGEFCCDDCRTDWRADNDRSGL